MYGNLAELVDFAYFLSCIGKGLRLQPAQQACFFFNGHLMIGEVFKGVAFESGGFVLNGG